MVERQHRRLKTLNASQSVPANPVLFPVLCPASQSRSLVLVLAVLCESESEHRFLKQARYTNCTKREKFLMMCWNNNEQFMKKNCTPKIINRRVCAFRWTVGKLVLCALNYSLVRLELDEYRIAMSYTIARHPSC